MRQLPAARLKKHDHTATRRRGRGIPDVPTFQPEVETNSELETNFEAPLPPSADDAATEEKVRRMVEAAYT